MIFLLTLAAFPALCFAQSKKLTVRGHTLLLREYTLRSEEDGPGDYDILLKLYRLEKGKPKYLYQHYRYKNEGGDCNNLFWAIGTYDVSGDTLRFTTHHCQKTGLDPIPEWEQKIYTLTAEGNLVLISSRYRERGSETWIVD